MSPRKQTTPRRCAVIVQLHKDGRSERDIASSLQLPKSTVHDCIQCFKSSGSGENKPQRGKARITDRRHDLRMRRLVLANPSMSSGEIKQVSITCLVTTIK